LGFRNSISHAVDLLGAKGVRVRVCSGLGAGFRVFPTLFRHHPYS
jgi:hypothetical protein